MFYKKLESSTTHITKSEAVIITSTGNKQRVIDIIRLLDQDEFEVYGIDNYGDFLIPVLEYDTDVNGDIDISNIEEWHYGYSGKFDFIIEDVIDICKKENIPFYYDTIRKKCCGQW